MILKYFFIQNLTINFACNSTRQIFKFLNKYQILHRSIIREAIIKYEPSEFKAVIVDLAESKLFQFSLTFTPNGVNKPTPVITTRLLELIFFNTKQK